MLRKERERERVVFKRTRILKTGMMMAVIDFTRQTTHYVVIYSLPDYPNDGETGLAEKGGVVDFFPLNGKILKEGFLFS